MTAVLKLLIANLEDSMAQNDRGNKKPSGGGPEAHPTNRGPLKEGGQREGRTQGQGGNKVTHGKGADTSNKGKN